MSFAWNRTHCVGSSTLALVLLVAPACTELLPGSDRLDGGGDALVTTDVDASDGQVASDGGDGSTCGSACPCTPAITSVSRSVVAHGARLVVSGTCLEGADALSIGGVAQTFSHANADLVVDEVTDGISPALLVPLVVSAGAYASAPYPLTVIRLLVNEVDSHSGNGSNDDHEFVELRTGLGMAADLTGYAVVFVSGDTLATYSDMPSIALGVTAANGRYVLGNPGVTGVRATFPSRSLGESNEVHAVLVLQMDDLPLEGTALSQIDAPIIDAIVYSKSSMSSNTALLDHCFPNAADRVQLNESATGDSTTASIVRCLAARRDGRAYAVSTPTPNLGNTCP